MIKKLISILFIALSLVACGTVETKKQGSSSTQTSVSDYYSGYFFDAAISGLKVVPINNKASKQKIRKYIRADDVRWQLTGKVKGGIVVRVTENNRSKTTIGKLTNNRAQVSFIALEGQKKSTIKALAESKDILVNGSGVVTVKNYAIDNRLPSGAYIIRIKVRGTENWDRKEVYIEVE